MMPSVRRLLLLGCWYSCCAAAFLHVPRQRRLGLVPPATGGGDVDLSRIPLTCRRLLPRECRRAPTDRLTAVGVASSSAPNRQSSPSSHRRSNDHDDEEEENNRLGVWKRRDERKAREMSWLVRSTSRLLVNEQVALPSDSHASSMTSSPSPPPGALPRDSIRTASAVLRAWARRRSPHVVERIILRINEERAAGNVHARATTAHYNSLLEAWCRCSSSSSSSVSSRSTSTFASNNGGENENVDEPGAAIARAAEILDEMESNRCGSAAPDARSYNVLLKALVRRAESDSTGGSESSSLSEAEALLKRAVTRGAVNTRSYNLLLAALARGGHAEKAEALLRDMQKLWEERAVEEGCPDVVPDANTYNQVISAWSKNGTRGSARRAQAVFDDLLAASNATKVRPGTETFNLLMGCWYHSGERDGPRRVEELFESMTSSYDAGFMDAIPDVVTVNTVLSAYARDGRLGAMEKARRVFETALVEYGVRANTLTYNLMLKALAGGAGTVTADAVETAVRILDAMEADFLDGGGRAAPDAFTFTSVLDIIAKSSEPDKGKRAEAILCRMERLSHEAPGTGAPTPTAQVYNALINCWASSSPRERGASRRAEAVLRRMVMCAAAGNAAAAPNTRSYNTVLKCLSRSGGKSGRSGPSPAGRAVALLDRMDEMARSAAATNRDDVVGGSGAVNVAVPDAYSYATVVHALARSSEPRKASKAQEILHRMVAAYDGGKGNASARPNVFAFNACLNACAFTSVPEEKMDAFLIAVATVLLLQKFDTPDSTTYGTFLRICSNLIPENDDRRQQSLVRVIFGRCATEGQVNGMVLEQLSFAAAPDVYEELVGRPFEEGVKLWQLPSEWRRNVKERRRSQR